MTTTKLSRREGGAAKSKSKRARGVRRPQRTEAGLAVTSFLAAASDPLEGLMALLDLTKAHLHESTAKVLRGRGSVPGPAPVPVSRLVTGFHQPLIDKVAALLPHLAPAEIDRLSRAAPGFLTALQGNDLDVFRIICEVLPYSPEVIARWIRTNVEWIERRFVS